MAGGAGGLLMDDIVTTELGMHAGLRLRGRARRQTLRLALGSRLRASAVWMRPVGVEVFGADAAGMRLVPISTPPDPRLQALGRIATLWLASMLVRGLVAAIRMRARSRASMPANGRAA